MSSLSKSVSVMEAMETMSEEDLVFIATTNPSLMKMFCLFLSLELQLEKEGKLKNFET